jgi:hypothetical protein
MHSTFRALCHGATLVLGLSLVASPCFAQRVAEAATSPFEMLSGSWTGNGVARTQDGNAERIRCRVTYQVSSKGNTLQHELRCASDSYNFVLRSDIAEKGGYLSGRWTEATRQTGGAISGTARPGEINALVEGNGFSANLTVATRGNRQQVAIRSPSTAFTDISMTLHRGGN